MTQKELTKMEANHKKAHEVIKATEKAIREEINNLVNKYGEIRFKSPILVDRGKRTITGVFWDTKSLACFGKCRVSAIDDNNSMMSIFENDTVILNAILNAI